MFVSGGQQTEGCALVSYPGELGGRTAHGDVCIALAECEGFGHQDGESGAVALGDVVAGASDDLLAGRRRSPGHAHPACVSRVAAAAAHRPFGQHVGGRSASTGPCSIGRGVTEQRRRLIRLVHVLMRRGIQSDQKLIINEKNRKITHKYDVNKELIRLAILYRRIACCFVCRCDKTRKRTVLFLFRIVYCLTDDIVNIIILLYLNPWPFPVPCMIGRSMRSLLLPSEFHPWPSYSGGISSLPLFPAMEKVLKANEMFQALIALTRSGRMNFTRITGDT